jgi:hypothetical protein
VNMMMFDLSEKDLQEWMKSEFLFVFLLIQIIMKNEMLQ